MRKIFQNIYLFVKLIVKCIFCRFFPFWEFLLYIKIYISVCTHKYTLAHEDPPIHACFIKYKNIANYASISIKMFNVFIIVHSFINMHECVCVLKLPFTIPCLRYAHTHIYSCDHMLGDKYKTCTDFLHCWIQLRLCLYKVVVMMLTARTRTRMTDMIQGSSLVPKNNQ